jgi:hypothetical protein
MKREQIQENFRQSVELSRHGTASERRTAATTLKKMIETYPWLCDYARLLGLTEFPGLTREFPWLAPLAYASAAQTNHVEPPGRAVGAARSRRGRTTTQSCATEEWVKPPTTPGLEYRQCYKPNCQCMNGGAWHGPYRYRKQRRGSMVRSEYIGREIASEQ